VHFRSIMAFCVDYTRDVFRDPNLIGRTWSTSLFTDLESWNTPDKRTDIKPRKEYKAELKCKAWTEVKERKKNGFRRCIEKLQHSQRLFLWLRGISCHRTMQTSLNMAFFKREICLQCSAFSSYISHRLSLYCIFYLPGL